MIVLVSRSTSPGGIENFETPYTIEAMMIPFFKVLDLSATDGE